MSESIRITPMGEPFPYWPADEPFDPVVLSRRMLGHMGLARGIQDFWPQVAIAFLIAHLRTHGCSSAGYFVWPNRVWVTDAP